VEGFNSGVKGLSHIQQLLAPTILAPGDGRNHEVVYTRGPSPVPHQGHTARVSTELLYIVFYPLQCCDLVQKSEVANRVVAGSRPQETCNGEKVQSAVKTLHSSWHFFNSSG
jgi:hypothetical protein